MNIVEYKRHLTNGVVADPEFISYGGVFLDPANKTWIGAVYPEQNRDYYVPDSLVYLTVEQLHARVQDVHTRFPFTKLMNPADPNAGSTALTALEVSAMVDAWVAQIEGGV